MILHPERSEESLYCFSDVPHEVRAPTLSDECSDLTFWQPLLAPPSLRRADTEVTFQPAEIGPKLQVR